MLLFSHPLDFLYLVHYFHLYCAVEEVFGHSSNNTYSIRMTSQPEDFITSLKE